MSKAGVLRQVADETWKAGQIGWGNACSDGAAEIERLQERLDTVREKCQEILAEYGHIHLDGGKYDAANEILRALDGESVGGEVKP
jgi:hypothetical protein